MSAWLRFVANIAAHTAPDGVWIDSDVCAPDDPDQLIALRLDDSNGADPNQIKELDTFPRERVAEYISGLSTRAKFDQFSFDFARNAGVAIRAEARAEALILRLADAMDFPTRKDYSDNWLSESHEQFCGLTFADWATTIGRSPTCSPLRGSTDESCAICRFPAGQ